MIIIEPVLNYFSMNHNSEKNNSENQERDEDFLKAVTTVAA